jgi:hypothetical protein
MIGCIDLQALKASFDALHEKTSDPNALEYGMAAKLIQAAMGRQWWLEHLELSSKPDDFARNGLSASDEEHFWYRRVVSQIADSLFLLRNATGYQILLDRLKTRPLRQTFFEAQAASQLAERGYNIEIFKERGVRRQDFDFRVKRAGLSINVEVTEAQIPTPDLSKLANKLGRKRGQLPDNDPAILFVIIQDAWAKTPIEADRALSGACGRLFRNSRRINAVVICWVTTLVTAEGGRIMAECFRVYEHTSPRKPVPDLGLIDQTGALPDLQSLISGWALQNGSGDALMKALQPRAASFIEWYKNIQH